MWGLLRRFQTGATCHGSGAAAKIVQAIFAGTVPTQRLERALFAQTRFYHPPEKLKVWKPTSPGQRGRITVDRANLYRGRPFKPLTVGIHKTGGRNHTGYTTVWHKGGGHKRLYRVIDLKRSQETESVVERIEYDPNRSARIALVRHLNETLQGAQVPATLRYAYLLAPDGIGEGDVVSSVAGAPVRDGLARPLAELPTGTVVHNIELEPGRGGRLCRAAGTRATLVKNGDDGLSLIALPSGEQRYVLSRCRATVGTVGNTLHVNRVLGKAGASRHLGIRPTTRALATNPRDHPAGGKNKKQRKTPWGKVFMGVKTRRPHKPLSRFIQLSRHQARAAAR